MTVFSQWLIFGSLDNVVGLLYNFIITFLPSVHTYRLDLKSFTETKPVIKSILKSERRAIPIGYSNYSNYLINLSIPKIPMTHFTFDLFVLLDI